MEQTSVVPTFFHLEGVNIAELGVKFQVNNPSLKAGVINKVLNGL
jgi:hypothetical protein